MRAADLAMIRTTGDDDVPLTTVRALLANGSFLVMAPHPDDESLACGALLAASFAGQAEDGRGHVVCLTDGAHSHPGSRLVPPEQLARIRRRELETAINILGGKATDVTWLGASDGNLAAAPEIVDHVTRVARDHRVGLLLAPSPLDPHCDHVAGAALGRAVAAKIEGVRLGFYPVWSRWHGGGRAPVPQGMRAVRLPPGQFAPTKAAAIAAHESQRGLVVPDAPDGFEMPHGFAQFFAERDEIYFFDNAEAQP